MGHPVYTPNIQTYCLSAAEWTEIRCVWYRMLLIMILQIHNAVISFIYSL